MRVCVTNRGEPISSGDLPHVFDRFYRGDKSRQRTASESGLGLAIAKSLVEAHHGQIGFTSVPEQGTRFEVCLPLDGEVKHPPALLEPLIAESSGEAGS